MQETFCWLGSTLSMAYYWYLLLVSHILVLQHPRVCHCFDVEVCWLFGCLSVHVEGGGKGSDLFLLSWTGAWVHSCCTYVCSHLTVSSIVEAKVGCYYNVWAVS